MEKESSPVVVEDKYAQRFSVKWIFTPRKFAFKKTNSGVNDAWPSIFLRWLLELSMVSISVFKLVNRQMKSICSRYREAYV